MGPRGLLGGAACLIWRARALSHGVMMRAPVPTRQMLVQGQEGQTEGQTEGRAAREGPPAHAAPADAHAASSTASSADVHPAQHPPVPPQGLAPSVAVAAASSEETLTGMPLVKTPDSLSLAAAAPGALGMAPTSSPSPLAVSTDGLSPMSPAAQPPPSSPGPVPPVPSPASSAQEAERRRLTEKRKAKRERQAAHLTPEHLPGDAKKTPTSQD